jgi:hypothetical protein
MLMNIAVTMHNTLGAQYNNCWAIVRVPDFFARKTAPRITAKPPISIERIPGGLSARPTKNATASNTIPTVMSRYDIFRSPLF